MELSEALKVLMEANVISDYADEYGEPGYSAEGPICFGDWWCKCADGPDHETYEDGTPKLHDIEHKYPEAFAALKEANCELEWLDEWVVSHESSPSKAYRIEADSYSWQSSILWTEGGEFLTPDDDLSDWIEELANDPHKCLTSRNWSNSEIEALGWEERECGFESGWYGQEDNPEVIFAAIKEREPNTDVLFVLSSVEQFRIKFCVFVKADETDGDEEE